MSSVLPRWANSARTGATSEHGSRNAGASILSKQGSRGVSILSKQSSYGGSLVSRETLRASGVSPRELAALSKHVSPQAQRGPAGNQRGEAIGKVDPSLPDGADGHAPRVV